MVGTARRILERNEYVSAFFMEGDEITEEELDSAKQQNFWINYGGYSAGHLGAAIGLISSARPPETKSVRGKIIVTKTNGPWIKNFNSAPTLIGQNRAEFIGAALSLLESPWLPSWNQNELLIPVYIANVKYRIMLRADEASGDDFRLAARLFDEVKRDFLEFMQHSKDKMKSLEDTYANHLKLLNAHIYYKKKADWHSISAGWFGFCAVMVLFSSIVFMLAHGSDL